FSSRRRHTRSKRDWSSDVCSSDLRETDMHVGLVMECDYREGRTPEEAFAEALSIAEIAEESGLDGVWLAERHFAAPRRPTDPGEIGRASCRERVARAVGAGSVRKQ